MYNQELSPLMQEFVDACTSHTDTMNSCMIGCSYLLKNVVLHCMPEKGYRHMQYHFINLKKLPKNSIFAILYKNNITDKNNLQLLHWIFKTQIEDRYLCHG